MTNIVVEWAPFRLAPGVDEATLRAASEALQRGFLAKQPGFLRRDLLKGRDGQWVDLVFWASQEAADQAVTSAAESAACYRYFQLMAGAEHADPGADVLHFVRIETYDPRP